jgi:hypothetical protein
MTVPSRTPIPAGPAYATGTPKQPAPAEAKVLDTVKEDYLDWHIEATGRHVQVQARRNPNRFYYITTIRATHPDGRQLAFTAEGEARHLLPTMRSRIDALEGTTQSPAEEAAPQPPPSGPLPDCEPDPQPLIPAPSPKAQPSATWPKAEAPRIELDPARLADGSPIRSAYSADKIANYNAKTGLSAIRKPFVYKGSLYTVTGIGRGAGVQCEAWELVPRDLYQGTPTLYRDKAAQRTYRNSDKYPGLEATDPIDFYEGIQVSHKGTIYVLTRPLHFVECQHQAEATPESEQPAHLLEPPPPGVDVVEHIEGAYERMVEAELADATKRSPYTTVHRTRPGDVHRGGKRRPRKIYILADLPNPNCLRCLGERVITYGDEKGQPCPACVTQRWAA